MAEKYKHPRLRTALIAFDPSGRVFLMEHTRAHGKYWVLPGGGVDPGECLENALVREIDEELGVICEIDSLAAIGELIAHDRHVVDFFFKGALERLDGFNIQADEGITDVGWFQIKDLDAMTILPPEIVPVLKKGMDVSNENVEYLGRYRIKD